MRTGFYFKLAAQAMGKNRRLYMPYFATCILMVAVYYILHFLGFSGVMEKMAGGGTATQMMQLGTYVMTLFGVIFLFYTQSTLMKGRKKEFGLYSILGMSKGNIGRIIFFETLITWGIALVGGIGAGIGLSKLAELGFARMVNAGVQYDFTVSGESLVMTAAVYTGIFLLLYLNSLRQVGLANPIELVRAQKEGEKPPKANWILGAVAVVVLGAGYYIALSIEQPMSALMWFFVAILLIIIGTYMVLIAGSVVFCRILRSRKSYYYKTQHFVSVSSMTYRMRRNGAGLASICILLAAILLMLSSTAALYTGRDQCLSARYPNEIGAYACKYGYDESLRDLSKSLDDEVHSAAREYGAEITGSRTYSEYSISGYFEDSRLDVSLNSKSNLAFIDYDKVVQTIFMDVEEYNRVFGYNEQVSEGEALVGTAKDLDIGEELIIGDVAFEVTRRIDKYVEEIDPSAAWAASPQIFVIVKDIDKVARQYVKYKDWNGEPMLAWFWHCNFDTGLDEDKQVAMAEHLEKILEQRLEPLEFTNMYCDSHESQKKDFLSTFGGLFFLGILLSLIFLVACVVIMYYKQVSEGFEDQSRFETMQKVGMTRKQISKSINSQMLTVFLIPIVFACIHIGVILPIINKLLMLFGLFNMPHLVLCTAVSAVICGLFYGVIYKVTSNAYLRIVTHG